jgi:xanthine dehydrogenase accessory factor
MSRLQEFQELFRQMKKAWENNEKTVLVILADVKGSAYRLPGTKMLMTSSGNMVGTISGGCLETDLFEWAKKVFENNKPMNLRYDLSETEIWTLGIGCKGNLEFLFLPIDPENPIWQKTDVFLTQNSPLLL